MGIEIERKFLVTGTDWKHGAVGVPYAQGYLSKNRGKTVRVRVAGSDAFLTVKGATEGISRVEFEYPIPVADAHAMLSLCEGPLIQKTRYRIPFQTHLWEVDVFEGDNAGLVVAEVELSHPDEPVLLPPWIGQEVSHDLRYSNVQLTEHPFCFWEPSVEKL